MRQSGSGRGNEAGDRLQREVLAYALVEHPVPVAIDDLREDLGRGPRIEEAVAALVTDGLLERSEEEVMPTPAALRFHQIEPIEPPSSE